MIIENKNKRYKVMTPSGFQNFDGLQKIERDSYLTFYFSNGEEFSCSTNHIFIYNNQEILAKDLKSGDFISHNNGIDEIEIIHIEYSSEEIELYDLLNVENGNIYNSGSVISHNCEFLGSAGTLISGSKLKVMTWKSELEYRLDYKLKIFKLPYKEYDENNSNRITFEAQYILIFDTGEGVGADSSTCQIFRIDQKPFEQVAVYKNNKISIRDFPAIVNMIAILYNNALIIGENNTIGAAILDDLYYDFEYENIFYGTEKKARDEEINDMKFGIRMTGRSKSLGCSNLKKNIEDDYFIINDEDTISEFTWFIKRGNSWAADDNRHDDLITPLIIFSYFLRNREWVDLWLSQEKEKMKNEVLRQMEEDLLPVGFVVNNGIESSLDELDDGNDDNYFVFV